MKSRDCGLECKRSEGVFTLRCRPSSNGLIEQLQSLCCSLPSLASSSVSTMGSDLNLAAFLPHIRPMPSPVRSSKHDLSSTSVTSPQYLMSIPAVSSDQGFDARQ